MKHQSRRMVPVTRCRGFAKRVSLIRSIASAIFNFWHSCRGVAEGSQWLPCQKLLQTRRSRVFFFGRASQKGAQITIEAIILVGILIVILMGTTMPMALKAQRSATEVSFANDAKYATEQILAAANSLSAPGAKRTIVVYIPGATSARNTSVGNRPFVNFTTYLSTDGSNLITTISMVRNNDDGSTFLNEVYTYSSALYGSGWMMYNAAGTAANLTETTGRKYRFTITWESNGIKNITYAPV